LNQYTSQALIRNLKMANISPEERTDVLDHLAYIGWG